MNFKEWMKKVTNSNKTFSKANKARKRVMIAKDVVEALETKLFQASGWSAYVDVKRYENDKGYNFSSNAEYRDKLVEANPVCDVCAKGALFLCTVMRRDNITVEQQYNINWQDGHQYDFMTSLTDAFGGIFDREQLNLIEGHYECGRTGAPHRVSNSRFLVYRPGAERLIAIMKNIIKHGGTFKPELE